MLLTPPFDRSEPNPGYIMGYLPGIRENGGQYTHGAVWAIMAYAKLGMGDEAFRIYNMLNPITHASNYSDIMKYKVEPYVVAADVYSVAPHVGRGGWTWYTGSAGWMYRAGLAGILGIRREGAFLVIDPCIPAHWEGFFMRRVFRGAMYEITVLNPEHVSRGVAKMTLDGAGVDGGGRRRAVVLGWDPAGDAPAAAGRPDRAGDRSGLVGPGGQAVYPARPDLQLRRDPGVSLSTRGRASGGL